MSDAGSSRSFPLMVILRVRAHLRILCYLSGDSKKRSHFFFLKFLRFLRPMLSSTQNFDNLLVYPLLQNAVVYLLVSSIFLSCMGDAMGGGRRNKNVVFFSGYVCRRTSSFRDDVRHISGGPQFVTRPVYRRTMKHMRTCTTLHTSDPSFAAIFMCTLDLCSQGLPLTRYLYVRCVFFLLLFSFSLFSFSFSFICVFCFLSFF